MTLISVRVKRPDAAHHQDGRIYKTGEIFQMEEQQFKDAETGIPGFFERAYPPMEQIKSKDLPKGAPIEGPAMPAVQEPEEPHQAETAAKVLDEHLRQADEELVAWKAAGIVDPDVSQIETMGGEPVSADPAPVTKKKLDLKKK